MPSILVDLLFMLVGAVCTLIGALVGAFVASARPIWRNVAAATLVEPVEGKVSGVDRR